MRGAVSVRNLSKRFGGTAAVDDVSLDVRPGEFLTLLGPSGCGKTTLLRLLAGFEAPDAGEILISGRDVAALPPYRRPVNTVFQHYALFPHRTVSGNVAFGLEAAGAGREEARAKVAKALGGPLKVVAYITDSVAIRRILDHLDLSPLEKPPPDVREVVRATVDRGFNALLSTTSGSGS